MSSEFGPRDEEASLLGRVSAPAIKATLAVTNLVGDVSVRYHSKKALLSVSGESEYSQQPFYRGMLAMGILIFSMFAPLMALVAVQLTMETVVELFGATAASPFLVLALPLMGYSFVNMFGMYSVADSISVVDHTTEPAPDALEDVKRRYENGEIDEAELEQEAAEVWER